jgi:hypothetical protein
VDWRLYDGPAEPRCGDEFCGLRTSCSSARRSFVDGSCESLESPTEGDARRAFQELARDRFESHGIAWRNRFIEGKK